MGIIYRRPPAASPESRCAAQIGNTDDQDEHGGDDVDDRGLRSGRNRLSKIQMRQRLQSRRRS